MLAPGEKGLSETVTADGNKVAVERNPHWRTQYNLREIAAEGGFPYDDFKQLCEPYFEPSEGSRHAKFHELTPEQVVNNEMLRFTVHRHLHHEASTAIRKYALHLTKAALDLVQPGSDLHQAYLGDIFSKLFDPIRAIQKSVIHFFERKPELIAAPLCIHHSRGFITYAEVLSGIGDALVTKMPGAIEEPLSRVEVTRLMLNCVNNGQSNCSEAAKTHLVLNLRRLLNPSSEFREQDPSLRMILVEGMAPLLDRPNIFVYYVTSLKSGFPHLDQLILDKLESFCLERLNGSKLDFSDKDREQMANILSSLVRGNGDSDSAHNESAIKARHILNFVESSAA